MLNFGRKVDIMISLSWRRIILGVLFERRGSGGSSIIRFPKKRLGVRVKGRVRDKGVEEFVAAARLLNRQGVSARFALVGSPDPENFASIPETQLWAWAKEGVVEYWGWRNDMAAVTSVR